MFISKPTEYRQSNYLAGCRLSAKVALVQTGEGMRASILVVVALSLASCGKAPTLQEVAAKHLQEAGRIGRECHAAHQTLHAAFRAGASHQSAADRIDAVCDEDAVLAASVAVSDAAERRGIDNPYHAILRACSEGVTGVGTEKFVIEKDIPRTGTLSADRLGSLVGGVASHEKAEKLLPVCISGTMARGGEQTGPQESAFRRAAPPNPPESQNKSTENDRAVQDRGTQQCEVKLDGKLLFKADDCKVETYEGSTSVESPHDGCIVNIDTAPDGFSSRVWAYRNACADTGIDAGGIETGAIFPPAALAGCWTNDRLEVCID